MNLNDFDLSNKEELNNLLLLRKKNRKDIYAIINEETNTKEFIEKQTGDIYVANTVVNKFNDFTEIIYYKQPFDYVLNKEIKKYNEDGERILKENPRYFVNENGTLKARREFLIDNLKQSIQNSSKRALDNFYGYALSNKWQYFITLTFDNKFVDRNDDEEVKYIWKKFRTQLQYINKDIKCLVVPERHEPNEKYPNGALHFHGLIGNIDLEKYLTVGINAKTKKPLFSKYGEQIYNITCFKYGYSTCVKLPKNYNQLKVTNYCIEYVTKQNNIGYNKKKYYRTFNLDFKNKVITNFSENELKNFTQTLDCQQYKENEKMIVFRKYSDLMHKEELAQKHRKEKIKEIPYHLLEENNMDMPF